MRREDYKKLTTNRRFIVKYLVDLESILDYLISKNIFTPQNRTKIISSSEPSDRIRQTLDILVEKSAKAYQCFIEALILSNTEKNIYVADILEPNYSSSDECLIMIRRENESFLPQFPQQISLQQQQQQQQETESRLYQTDFTSNLSCSTLSSQEYVSTPVSARMKPPSNLALPQHLLHSSSLSNNRPNSICSNLSSQSSRSNSHSMSPTISRARSSSVTSAHHLHNTRLRSSNNRLIINRKNSADLISEHAINHVMSTPVVVSSDQNDQYTSPTSNDRPQVYNLNWNDVNNLELDFHVYTSDTMPVPGCYTMTKKPRGLCLIINNENFHNANGIEMPSYRRVGTNMDASRLRNLFEKLHFLVEICVDLTEKDMRIKLGQFAQECERNGDLYDSITLIILTHGSDGYVYGVDSENSRININNDILPLFDDVLIGKPKLFIFQACRGDNVNQKEDKLVRNVKLESNSQANTPATATTSKMCSLTKSVSEEVDILSSKLNTMSVSSIQTQTQPTKYIKNSKSSNNNNNKKSKKKNQQRSRSHSRSKYSLKSSSELSNSNFMDGIPIKTYKAARSDMLIWYSSVKGFVSHRDPDGSPFIKCLVTVFSRCAYDLEIMEMIRKVNMLMQQYERESWINEPNVTAKYMMNPALEFHLAKALYFNP